MSARLRAIEVRSIEHAIAITKQKFNLETSRSSDKIFNSSTYGSIRKNTSRFISNLIEKAPSYPLVDCRHVDTETYLSPTEITNLLNMRIWR